MDTDTRADKIYRPDLITTNGGGASTRRKRSKHCNFHKSYTTANKMTSKGASPRQQRRTAAQLIGLIFCCGVWLAGGVAADDEVVSSQPRVVFKNEEFLNRKTIPDVQTVLQKPLTDKKFENLNTFLVVLKSSLTEAGYQASPGE